MDELLSLEHVAVGYGSEPILADVNLTLGRASFTGLLGPNGSGKSTLLKAVLGITPPLGGRVRFGALEDGQPPVLGYVPQREALDPVYLLSALEVVLMGACGRVGPGRFISRVEREWAHQCLRETGANDLSRKPFSVLSGGQRQRVLIARALATRPDLLVLDEPTAGIDANATQAIMDLLRRLHQERRLAILMVNHDLSAVHKSVEQVIWLHHGQVLFGPVAELLSRERIEAIMQLEID